MITALFFDLDGTLFDSTEANIAAYTLAFKDAGLTLNVNVYRQNFGLRFHEMMRLLAPDASQKTLSLIKTSKAKHYKNSLQLVRANDGLLALLKSCRGNYKTALVTTARRENVDNLLHYFDINNSLFDTIITGEDVATGKPDPECYELALQRLDVAAKDCCIFEDSAVGIEAAKRVGARTIQVVM